MRCPKCHYLGFDPEPRCKNCGYDLEVEADESELALRIEEPEPEPARDLPLRAAPPVSRPITLELVRPVPEPIPAPAPAPAAASVPDREPVLVGATVAASPVRRVARAPHTTTELPLFVKAMAAMEPVATASSAAVVEPPPVSLPESAPDAAPEPDFEPEIVLPPAARPLSVRRHATETAKVAARVERRVGPLDRDLLDDLRRLERDENIRVSAREFQSAGAGDIAGETVRVSHRFGAAAVDGLLLGGIGAFVLWATLKLCNATPADLGASALVALGVFLGGLAVAYLLMFTAADGQTVGKMLMGIRVVGNGDSDRLTIGQAAGRALLAPLSVGALGLGWVPVVFGRGDAIHDRLAHTRVVRA